ncbi:MAG: hypothetical protein ACHQQQ_12480 [Bacteroidota bacterium]
MQLTGKKQLLLFLYAPEENNKFNCPIAGRTRLMKMSFLFSKEVLPDFEKDRTFEKVIPYEFHAWKYGPFSKSLLNDLEFLINQQYIIRGISNKSPLPAELAEFEYWIEDMDEYLSREYDEEVFELSNDKGIPKAREVWKELSSHQIKFIVDFKRIMNRVPLDKILEYVYKKYQKHGYIDNSVIREKYLS